MKGDSAGETSPAAPQTFELPGIFLMTNSLETGGSERQFVALAQTLNLHKFRRAIGCVMRKGPLADHAGVSPGGQSLWFEIANYQSAARATPEAQPNRCCALFRLLHQSDIDSVRSAGECPRSDWKPTAVG